MNDFSLKSKLIRFRDINNISQFDIAFCCNVPNSIISDIVHGKKTNTHYEGCVLDFISGKSELCIKRYKKLMKRKEIGRRLKENRLSKNISLTDIMFRLDVIHRVISDIESGRFDFSSSSNASKRMRQLYFDNDIITEEEYKEITNTRKLKPELIIINNSLNRKV